MGTGDCLFFAGKIGFHAQGLEFIVKKTIENGDGIDLCEAVTRRMRYVRLGNGIYM